MLTTRSRSQRLHRNALLWLKEWDACVFKGSSKANAAAELKRERRNKRARDGGFGAGSGAGAGAAEGGFEDVVCDPRSPRFSRSHLRRHTLH